MSPEDVGGDDILNNIKRDVMEMLDNAVPVSMNQMCYCKAPLERAKYKRSFDDWWCLSCFAKQSGRVQFNCNNDQCLFKRLSGWSYIVCPTCFERAENDVLRDNMDEKGDGIQEAFIGSKVTQVLDTIGMFNSYRFTFCRAFVTPKIEEM